MDTKDEAPGKESAGPPPPPTFGGELVTMMRPAQPEREARPAHYVRKYQRRGELNESSDDPSDDAQGFHLPTAARRWAKLVRRNAKFFYWWLITHRGLITHPSRADWTVNQLLREGHSFQTILDELEIDSIEGLMQVGLQPPLSPALWSELVRLGLTYPDLLSLWNYVNVEQYRAAGVTPDVLSELGVDAEMLMNEGRFDASTLGTYSYEGWKRLGLRSTHLQRLGSNAITAFTPGQWRALGLMREDLSRLGLSEADVARRFEMSLDDLLCGLAAQGDYQLVGAGHTHEITLDAFGNGCSEPGADGHVHEVIDGKVRGKHTHRLIRYED